jgi:hypothetical protein
MLAAQARSTSAAGVVQQRQQQVLDGDELVALLARLDERHVQADFKFLRNHAASIMHCRGWPAAGRRPNQLHLGRGDVLGEDTADATPLVVDFEHDLRRRIEVMPEKFLQNHDYKLHRREIVVQQQDLVEPRRLGLLGLRSTTTAPSPSSRPGFREARAEVEPTGFAVKDGEHRHESILSTGFPLPMGASGAAP